MQEAAARKKAQAQKDAADAAAAETAAIKAAAKKQVRKATEEEEKKSPSAPLYRPKVKYIDCIKNLVPTVMRGSASLHAGQWMHVSRDVLFIIPLGGCPECCAHRFHIISLSDYINIQFILAEPHFARTMA